MLGKAALEATAHHEAGHAVAAVMRGIKIGHVTIKGDQEAAGHIRFLRPSKGLEQLHKRGMIALAGEAAQRRFNPRSIRRHHGAGDREAVLAFALDACGSTRQAGALVKLWTIQAAEFVDARWTAIQRVAAELLTRQTLAHDDVRRLVFAG